ncbi:Transcriptional regulator, ROK family [Saccharothrix espanaensis DSM 44229]|uniref:Transcriptional regulator, ROK family n=2 Tax=Saccharothrix espanaensis TaxID=103731 RepID=K0K8E2_SACES|nr:Transcriptional regulator, ROK family [Saccharothrix espanaensis DSM 44229]
MVRKSPQVGTPAGMRVLNQRAVLDRLRRGGPATRPQVAKDTGLSKPTVGQALLDLEQHGLVRPIGRTTSGPGRSAMVYEPNPAAGHVLGIDIGRQRIRVAVADLAGSVIARVDERNRCRSAGSLVRTVRELAERTVADAGLAMADLVVKVVGTPGVPDPRGRALTHAPNLPGWERRGLLDDLEAQLGPDLLVENDANLAAVGERAYGAARDVDVFVCVMVGTGIGMGIVVDGRLFRGAHGAAGEIGYLPWGAPSEVDDNGRGRLEAAAAAESVVALAKQHGIPTAKSARDVFLLAKSGDERALRAVRDEAERLAFVVASVAAVIDPELVVLGGGIGQNTELLAEPMAQALRRMTPLAPRIATGELGDGAVLSGAIAMGLRSARDLVFDRRIPVTL